MTLIRVRVRVRVTLARVRVECSAVLTRYLLITPMSQAAPC